MVFTAMAVSASAAMTIRGNYTGSRWQLYLFKPLTMVILIASLLPSAGLFAAWQWLIVLGLVFSLAGDVFLMLPSDKFIAGLASFLVAHLCYIGAFYPHYGRGRHLALVGGGVGPRRRYAGVVAGRVGLPAGAGHRLPGGDTDHVMAGRRALLARG